MLEVEQVGGLGGADDGTCWVDQLPAVLFGVRQDGEDPAWAEQRGPSARTLVLKRCVGVQGRNDQLRLDRVVEQRRRGGEGGEDADVAAETLDGRHHVVRPVPIGVGPVVEDDDEI